MQLLASRNLAPVQAAAEVSREADLAPVLLAAVAVQLWQELRALSRLVRRSSGSHPVILLLDELQES